MLSKAVILLSTACLFASASAAVAQVVPVYSAPSRFAVGADFAISQPKGEFATAGIPTGYGFDFTGLLNIDPQGWIALRADGGENQRKDQRDRLKRARTLPEFRHLSPSQD